MSISYSNLEGSIRTRSEHLTSPTRPKGGLPHRKRHLVGGPTTEPGTETKRGRCQSTIPARDLLRRAYFSPMQDIHGSTPQEGRRTAEQFRASVAPRMSRSAGTAAAGITTVKSGMSISDQMSPGTERARAKPLRPAPVHSTIILVESAASGDRASAPSLPAGHSVAPTPRPCRRHQAGKSNSMGQWRRRPAHGHP